MTYSKQSEKKVHVAFIAVFALLFCGLFFLIPTDLHAQGFGGETGDGKAGVTGPVSCGQPGANPATCMPTGESTQIGGTGGGGGAGTVRSSGATGSWGDESPSGGVSGSGSGVTSGSGSGSGVTSGSGSGVTSGSGSGSGVTSGSGSGSGVTSGSGSGGITGTKSLINPISCTPGAQAKGECFAEFLLKIIEILLVFAVPLIVIFIMYAGYLFVTAAGNTEQLSTARTALLWAVVGGVIVLGARVILEIIQGTVAGLR